MGLVIWENFPAQSDRASITVTMSRVPLSFDVEKIAAVALRIRLPQKRSSGQAHTIVRV